MESSRLRVALWATLFFTLSFSSSTHAQTLTAVKCNGTLPSARVSFAMLYDEQDSIYIFGGYNGMGPTDFDDVIKYSISMDTAQIVGQLPYPDYGGGAVMDHSTNRILYLSGMRGPGDIFQYFPDSRSFLNVSSFPQGKSFFGTGRPDNSTALLFGGSPSPHVTVTRLNLNSLESEDMAPLSKGASSPAVIWVGGDQDVAYVFDDFGVSDGGSVQKYFRASNRSEELALKLPVRDMSDYGAVWDGNKFGYLLGNVTGGHPTRSLAQFDPAREAFEIIPVEGYLPVNYPSAVYIEKLNRIYSFGGFTPSSGLYHDGIYYIDLDPLAKT